VASLASSNTKYSTVKSPSFFGSSAAEFFCGIPTTAVAPVDDAITPIFNWASAEAEASATARASKCESLRFMSVPVRQRKWASARAAVDSTERR
jgi:hypothetical protein